jgi:hypothetical protein
MTPVILPRRHPYLHSNGGDGNYATKPPRYEHAAHLHGTEAYRSRHGHGTSHQRMERPKDQRPIRLHATEELLPPDKEEDDHA